MRKSLNILIVDDIFINRMLLAEIAEGIDAQYCEAKNGKEAIEAMKIEAFDVVLMDIEMPVMNGFETTKYIRKSFGKPKCDTPIIAITAHVVTKTNADFHEGGFTDILPKPYTVDRLEKVLFDLFPEAKNEV